MKTLKSTRLHIGIFGKTNVGKSSFVNRISNQDISIVSDKKGTTTDVVEKSMELLPIGAVTFLDTAGLDDKTELASLRIEKTLKILNRTDVAVIIIDENGINKTEKNLIEELNKLEIPYLFVINQFKKEIQKEKFNEICNFSSNILKTSVKNDEFIIDNFKKSLMEILPEDFVTPPKILGDILPKKSTVILVTPIDKQAPKGRLILPQVQTIRDLLDNDCLSLVVKESELEQALNSLKEEPSLVVTDSQAFKTVSKIVPKNIKLTSFSILFARLKGDLDEFLNGIKAIRSLKNNSKVLILESCTHHQTDDDIAKVKIPKWLKEKTGLDLIFEYYSGHDMPKIEDYDLIIHCGACMTNRKEMISRIMIAKQNQIPITNYGIVISYCLGILDRATEIFNK